MLKLRTPRTFLEIQMNGGHFCILYSIFTQWVTNARPCVLKFMGLKLHWSMFFKYTKWHLELRNVRSYQGGKACIMITVKKEEVHNLYHFHTRSFSHLTLYSSSSNRSYHHHTAAWSGAASKFRIRPREQCDRPSPLWTREHQQQQQISIITLIFSFSLLYTYIPVNTSIFGLKIMMVIVEIVLACRRFHCPGQIY